MASNEKSPAMSSIDVLDVLQSVDEQISNPGAFCTTSTENAASLCLLMTKLFKVSAHSTNKTFGPFDELLVDGFDGETIWEELQTRNRPLTRFLQKKINVIHGRVQKVINSKHVAKSARSGKLTGKQLVDSTEPNSEDDEIADDDAEGSSIEDRLSASDMQDSDDEDDRDGDDNEEEEEEEEENGSIDEDVNLEILDDEDFDDEYSGGGDAEYDDIDNMQAWLDKQEEMEERHEKKLERLQKLAAQKGAVEEGSDSDEEEDDMLFMETQMYDDHESEKDASDEEEPDANRKKSDGNLRGSEIRYEDFFRGDMSAKKSTPSSSSSAKKEGSASSRKESKVSSKKDEDEDEEEGSGFDGEEDSEGDFDEAGQDDYDFGDDGDDDDGDGDDGSLVGGASTAAPVQQRALTTHEKREQRMALQIAQIESELIGEKPWDMRGEIKSLERPENSLLEITAQVERASKSAPMATEEFTSSLEDMIIKRIREEQFDDVVAKEVVEDVIGGEGDDKHDLSQEKSRIGLGEVYAEAFLATATSGTSSAKEAKEKATRDEIKELYHKVCRQLDGLSHFHFTPRPVVLESRVFGAGPENALPSLSLEDIIPTTENSGGLLAPEEIKDRKRGRAAALVADEELSRDDKRRLRRASKSSGKKEKKSKDEEERRVAGTDGSSAGNKARRKQEDKKTDEVLKSDRRVVEGTEEASSDSYAKSAAFFSKLQRTAQEAIGEASNGKGKGKKRGFDPDADDVSGVKRKASGFKL